MIMEANLRHLERRKDDLDGLRPISTLKPTEKATAQFRAKVQAAKDCMIEEEKARFAMHEEHALFADPGPSIYEEAASGPEAAQWKAAIAEELQAMVENVEVTMGKVDGKAMGTPDGRGGRGSTLVDETGLVIHPPSWSRKPWKMLKLILGKI
jgi:hypothetical protein